MTTATYTVTGMTCEHCVKAVDAEVSALEGVSSVEITLVPQGASEVRITSAKPLDVRTLREAVDEAGYELAGPM